MMKRALATLVVFVIILSSCADSVDGYSINGQIKGLANQDVVLEFLGSQDKRILIDTVTTDADGNFEMNGNVVDKGFYKISNGQKFWIVLLDNIEMDFVADANDPTGRELSIEGYEEGKHFQNTIDFLIAKQQEYQQEAKRIESSMYDNSITQEEKDMLPMQFEAFQKNLMESIKTEASSYIDENPFSAVYLMTQLNPQQDAAFIEENIVKLEAKMPNSVYLKNIKNAIVEVEKQEKEKAIAEANAQKVSNGAKAQEIVMANPDGKNLKLSDLRGKVVLVDFWASWCRPCRAENPNIVRAYHQYKNKGFEVFSVSLDKNMDAWKRAIAQDGLVWSNHVSDLKFWQNAAAKSWGISSIPAAFLLDKEGNIVGKNLRGAALEAKLKEYL